MRVRGPDTYDAKGNILTDAQGRSFTWDFGNRLTQAVAPRTNGGTTTFKYDPFGRRIQKSGPLRATNYVYDGASITEEVDAAGLVQARYAQGPGIDEPVAMLRGGNLDFFAADGLGSVTSLTDASGAIGASYSYESFGGLLSTTGALVNSLRYTAREYDAETGLYYYRARYYDPSTGRLISEDPMGFGAGVNFYGYVSNSPMNFIDPFGLSECRPVYCDSQVLKAIKDAYMRAVLANRGFRAGETQHEAGFAASVSPSGGYTIQAAGYGEANAQLQIPMPHGPKGLGPGFGATFHTHVNGNGMPSTPLNNVTGSRDKGDTIAATESGFDVYVISAEGLAVAPSNSDDPVHGAGSHFIIQGNNFGKWYKALLALCKSLK